MMLFYLGRELPARSFAKHSRIGVLNEGELCT